MEFLPTYTDSHILSSFTAIQILKSVGRQFSDLSQVLFLVMFSSELEKLKISNYQLFAKLEFKFCQVIEELTTFLICDKVQVDLVASKHPISIFNLSSFQSINKINTEKYKKISSIEKGWNEGLCLDKVVSLSIKERTFLSKLNLVIKIFWFQLQLFVWKSLFFL